MPTTQTQPSESLRQGSRRRVTPVRPHVEVAGTDPTDTQPTDHSEGFTPMDSAVRLHPTLDTIQDYPALWDWRIVVAFVAIGSVALYYL